MRRFFPVRAQFFDILMSNAVDSRGVQQTALYVKESDVELVILRRMPSGLGGGITKQNSNPRDDVAMIISARRFIPY
jgi:hypothetical protein